MEIKTEKKREAFLDIFRAVCIAFVMIQHRNLLMKGLGVFVLPGFFIASGYNFHVKEKTFKEFFIKKLKRLLIPFWTAMVVLSIAESIRAYVMGYGGVELLIPSFITTIYGSFVNFPCVGQFGQYLYNLLSFQPQTPGVIVMILNLTAHLWFLPALFSANIILYLLFKIRNDKFSFDFIFMILFLLIAGIETIPKVIQFPYGLGRGFFAASLMLCGYWMKKIKLFSLEKIKLQLFLLIIAIPISIFSVVYKYDGTGIVRSVYGNRMFIDLFITFICGLAFSYVVMLLIYYFTFLPFKKVIDLLSYAGMNSLEVYLWHMLVYFLGDMVAIFIFKFKLSPDKFFFECFAEGYVLYRVFMVVIAYAGILVFFHLKKKYFNNKNVIKN